MFKMLGSDRSYTVFVRLSDFGFDASILERFTGRDIGSTMQRTLLVKDS